MRACFTKTLFPKRRVQSKARETHRTRGEGALSLKPQQSITHHQAASNNAPGHAHGRVPASSPSVSYNTPTTVHGVPTPDQRTRRAAQSPVLSRSRFHGPIQA